MHKFLIVLLFPFLTACGSVHGPAVIQPKLYEIDGGQEARPQVPSEGQTSDGLREMAATIEPYKAQLDAKMNQVLAEVATPLVKASPEGNLGNWMADIMYAAASEYFPDREIAFAVTNSGGLRVSEIGAGPLLVSEVYELMPFDNALVVLQMTGAQVTEFLNHVANSGGWPVSDQLRVSRSGGKLKAEISGQSVDPNKTYYMATIDYVANGGSDASMLTTLPQIASGRFLRDVLIEFAARSEGPINVVSTGERMRL